MEVTNKMEKLRMVGSKTVREVLSIYPEYTLYIRKGFAFKGAREFLEDKETKPTPYSGGLKSMTFEERMQYMYDHYVVYDVVIDHEINELHINAYTADDMF